MKDLSMFFNILPKNNIHKNKNLVSVNTLHLSAMAETYLVIQNDKQLFDCLRLLDSIKKKYIILGNGSNIVFKSKRIKSTILHLKGEDVRFYPKSDGYIVSAFAGVPLQKVVNRCIKMGAGGMEWAVGIPGTVGGAVAMNAGAFGHSMSDVVKKVVCYKDYNLHNISNVDCGFGYRVSGFTDSVIVRIIMFLPYKDVDSVRSLTKDYLSKRLAKAPKGYSAGSVFKNQQKPAGFYLEQVGLKGYKDGDAFVSNTHANFIINNGKAKGSNVYKLIKIMQKRVYKKFKVKLEPEVKIY